MILQVKSDDAEGLKDNQAEKRVTVDLSKVSPEQLLKFTTESMNIANMFCQIGQDGSSIDIIQLLLTAIYGVEAFAEIADRGTSVVYGAHVEVRSPLVRLRPFRSLAATCSLAAIPSCSIAAIPFACGHSLLFACGHLFAGGHSVRLRPFPSTHGQRILLTLRRAFAKCRTQGPLQRACPISLFPSRSLSIFSSLFPACFLLRFFGTLSYSLPSSLPHSLFVFFSLHPPAGGILFFPLRRHLPSQSQYSH